MSSKFFGNSKEKKFLNNLKRGDRIITKSGVHARITEFDSKSIFSATFFIAG